MRKKIVAVVLCAMCLSATPIMQTENAFAAETYLDNWYMDDTNTWHFRLDDGSLAKNGWIFDGGEQYLVDENGDMVTGLVKCKDEKYYILDPVRDTGTYGKCLMDGSVYEGITISASTELDGKGSLSDSTLAELRAKGVDVDGARYIANDTNYTKIGSQIIMASTGEVTGGASGATKDIPMYY